MFPQFSALFRAKCILCLCLALLCPAGCGRPPATDLIAHHGPGPGQATWEGGSLKPPFELPPDTPLPEQPDLSAILARLPKAPPLPQPEGKVVRVGNVKELYEAVENLEDNTTLLLEDGEYVLDRFLDIRKDGVRFRSASGNREAVVLDAGGRYHSHIELRGASDFLLADVTLRNAMACGLKIFGDSDVQRLRVHNVFFHNIWVRAVKGTHPARIGDNSRNLHPPEVVERVRPGKGEIRYCLFYNDHKKTDVEDFDKGNYIASIDMMGLNGWLIADNAFVNIRGYSGRGRGAVFVWIHSNDVRVERNLFFYCDRCCSFGNPSYKKTNMTDGVIRNNVFVGGTDSAVEVITTRGVRVENNTVYMSETRWPGIHVFRGAPGLVLKNNLVHGWVACPEDGSIEGNLAGDVHDWFRAPVEGDLRLSPEGIHQAAGKGAINADVSSDFTGQPRPTPPTPGAYEPGDS